MFTLTKNILDFIKNGFTKTPSLKIYTDGGCKKGVGSWAYLILQNEKLTVEKSDRTKCYDSNIMELQAAIEALSVISEKSKITLYSDSRILVDAMKTRTGPPVFKKQLEELISFDEKHIIQWKWVKAHNGNEFNERCDELCILARK